MSIPIVIVSGFLGAGKTTCIQQLLQELPDTKRIMVIENDFGSVSYDADVLAAQGVRLKALPSGCICCSLAGNFLQALRSVLLQADVDLIIIEPSGVAKVSDVLRVCERPEIADKVIVVGVVTVVDGQKGLFYVEQFGEFFADQIHYADMVLLNRVDPKPEWYDETLEAIRAENGHARILTAPLEPGTLRNAILGWEEGANKATEPAVPTHHHDHDHHHGEEIFQAVTLEAGDILTTAQWKQKVETLLQAKSGVILRLKGIVPSLKGYISIQYSGGPLVIEPSDAKGQIITVIGSQIKEGELQALWRT